MLLAVGTESVRFYKIYTCIFTMHTYVFAWLNTTAAILE